MGGFKFATMEWHQPLRVLDFDIEARPLGWYGGDFVHKEPTMISSCWTDDTSTMETGFIHGIGRAHRSSMRKMLLDFKKRYDEADIVAGHYIRGYDLPGIQAALIEYDLPLLGPKLTSDTKGDLIKFSGLSKSQQNLGGMLGIESPKIGMSMDDWRRANRLQKDGIQFSMDRCEGDVIQNIEMRNEMKRRGILGPPKVWEPSASIMPKYEA